MKMRGGLLLFGLLIFWCGNLEAKKENGLSVIVQKTTLDAEKDRATFSDYDSVKRSLGLKLEIKNVSFDDFPKGTIKYDVIVKKWGSAGTYESYSGTEEMPPLLRSQSVRLVVAEVPLVGYEGSAGRNAYMDKIEAYKIVISHGDETTFEVTSSSSFEDLKKKAKPIRKGKKGRN